MAQQYSEQPDPDSCDEKCSSTSDCQDMVSICSGTNIVRCTYCETELSLIEIGVRFKNEKGSKNRKCALCKASIVDFMFECSNSECHAYHAEGGFHLCMNCSMTDKQTSTPLENIFKDKTEKAQKISNKMEDNELKEIVASYYLYEMEELKREKTKLNEVSKTFPHCELESFALMPENIPRLLVIGETRIGKSSFCNKMAGVYYKYVEMKINKSKEKKEEKAKQNDKSSKSEADSDSDSGSDSETEIEMKIVCDKAMSSREEIFKSSNSQSSETQTTSWAQVNFLGNEKKPLIIIDTPGLNDITDEKSNQHRSDLQAKLAAMRRVDLVLILLGKQDIGAGGGFRQSTFVMLSDIIQLFGGNEHLYKHFAIGFACCDEWEKQWKENLQQRKQEWKEKLEREFFGKNKNDKMKKDEMKNEENFEMKMFTLSSVNRSDEKKWSQKRQFKELYRACHESVNDALYTTDFLLMKKIKKAIDKIHETQGTTFDESLEYLQKEIILYKKKLRLIHENNIKYLDKIPKNVFQGIVKFGKCIGKGILIGAIALISRPIMVGKELIEKQQSKTKKVAAGALAIVLSPLTLYQGAVFGINMVTFGVVGGVAALGHGTINTFRSNESIVSKSKQKADEYYKRKSSQIIDDCLNCKKPKLKNLSFVKQLYAKLIIDDSIYDCCP